MRGEPFFERRKLGKAEELERKAGPAGCIVG